MTGSSFNHIIRFRTESTASLAGGGNVYSQTLRYFNPQKGTTARFSGAVSEWQQNQGTDSNTYGFAYDAAGRLTAGTRYAGSSTTGAASFTERGISYDKAGGMLAIQRYGSNVSTPEDNLTLTYNGMKLASVTGTIGGQTVGAVFTYDACGRTLADGVSMLNYQYNLLGALTTVEDAGTATPVTISTYRHLAEGTKYMTVSAGNNGALLYRGPLTFTIADVTATTPAISFLRAETGSVGAAIIANASGSGAAPYFYVTDQLGSVRAVVDSQGSVVERNDYYTYGKRHTTGRTYADLKNSPLLFSGKEDQGQALDLASGTTTPSDLRILDFGARHYDPIVPRWTTPDPLAEKYFPINTYAYCAGNPVNLVDPTGSEIRGNRKKDIQNVIEDLNIIFSDSVFDNFRKLIIQNGKKKNGLSLAKISNEDLTKAFDGITLNNDQLINGYYIRNFFHSHPTNAKPSDKDKSAFETIINNQSKRGWLPPITGIYYVGSQEDKKNKYFYYENE